MVRLTGLLLAALAAGTIVAGMVTSAVADVDPASDVLLQQDTFLPYQGQVCSQIKDALGKAAGATDQELAEQLGCSRRTIANKLKLIRLTWEDER